MYIFQEEIHLQLGFSSHLNIRYWVSEACLVAVVTSPKICSMRFIIISPAFGGLGLRETTSPVNLIYLSIFGGNKAKKTTQRICGVKHSFLYWVLCTMQIIEYYKYWFIMQNSCLHLTNSSWTPWTHTYKLARHFFRDLPSVFKETGAGVSRDKGVKPQQGNLMGALWSRLKPTDKDKAPQGLLGSLIRTWPLLVPGDDWYTVAVTLRDPNASNSNSLLTMIHMLAIFPHSAPINTWCNWIKSAKLHNEQDLHHVPPEPRPWKTPKS